jgi:NADH-ubiquinone oxidoreductase chain 6
MVIAGGLIFYILWYNKFIINYIDLSYFYNNLFFSEFNFFIENSSFDNLLIGSNQIKVIAYSLYTHLSLWLIITSFILLLAMIGPIILCFKSFYACPWPK